MLKPPAALIPGIAGGATANTRASVMPANFLLSAARIAAEVRSRPRSSHGLRPMKRERRCTAPRCA